ncbi:MAG: AmmeMemoRadiSam system radical SAM enzyme, partial [Archaeoglobi archaeon]|nr:AmmeMemoRadiSam system radical SAM enzyme [Archaeoglobi archaeon]
MVIESYLYEKAEGFVICKTCWHRCRLRDQQWGICKVRKNENGKLMVYNYGLASSIALDPIEKKPMHNYMPGSKVLS